MANKTRETLFERFAEALGEHPPASRAEGLAADASVGRQPGDSAGSSAAESDSAAKPVESFANAAGAVTNQATHSNLTSQIQSGQQAGASTSDGPGSTVSSIAKAFLESGLGLAPLVGELLGLFDGGPSTPPPLVKYSMPDKLYFEGADTGSGISGADYDQMGLPRLDGSVSWGSNFGTGATNLGGRNSAGDAASPGADSNHSTTPAQIQVNVQAMDAQSFLDHSSEIAQAVRQAMLNLNSLNDVVNDL
jgi:hypothetical protein